MFALQPIPGPGVNSCSTGLSAGIASIRSALCSNGKWFNVAIPVSTDQ
jgi:hypothetical protein